MATKFEGIEGSDTVNRISVRDKEVGPAAIGSAATNEKKVVGEVAEFLLLLMLWSRNEIKINRRENQRRIKGWRIYWNLFVYLGIIF